MSSAKTELLDLPFECLFQICEQMDIATLINLAKTCKAFEEIVNFKCKKLTRYMPMVAYDPTSITFRRECSYLTYSQRLDIGFNWMNGDFVIKKYKDVKKCKLELTKTHLYFCFNDTIARVERYPNAGPLDDSISDVIDFNYMTPSKEKVTDFCLRNDTLFEVRYSGIGYLHENGQQHEVNVNKKPEDLICDFQKQFYVVCSRNKMHLFNRVDELGMVELITAHSMRQAYEIICLSEDCSALYTSNGRALEKYNIETLQKDKIIFIVRNRFRQIRNMNEHSILAMSDSNLYIFDIRANNSYKVKKYFDDALSCFDFDGIYGLVFGMQYKPGIQLFDLRWHKYPVQRYTTNIRNAKSLVCDTRYLFGNWNNTINCLDFQSKSFIH